MKREEKLDEVNAAMKAMQSAGIRTQGDTQQWMNLRVQEEQLLKLPFGADIHKPAGEWVELKLSDSTPTTSPQTPTSRAPIPVETNGDGLPILTAEQFADVVGRAVDAYRRGQ